MPFHTLIIEKCANSGLKIQVRGFINNIHIIIRYSINIETNCKILEKAHKEYLNQAQIP